MRVGETVSRGWWGSSGTVRCHRHSGRSSFFPSLVKCLFRCRAKREFGESRDCEFGPYTGNYRFPGDHSVHPDPHVPTELRGRSTLRHSVDRGESGECPRRPPEHLRDPEGVIVLRSLLVDVLLWERRQHTGTPPVRGDVGQKSNHPSGTFLVRKTKVEVLMGHTSWTLTIELPYPSLDDVSYCHIERVPVCRTLTVSPRS